MDKVFLDRAVTVLVLLLLLVAAIVLHVHNAQEYANHCPPERLTRLCVE
jgi:hypothetical protein